MSISSLSPSVVQDLIPNWIHITDSRPLPPIPTEVPARLNMHPYTRVRSARSHSQSSDETLVSWDVADKYGRDTRDADRTPWIRIPNLPPTFAKHFPLDESMLEVLDDKLLDDPFDSFAEDCYAHAVSDALLDEPPAYHHLPVTGHPMKVTDDKPEMNDFIQPPPEPEVEDEVLDITFPQIARWNIQTNLPSDRLHRSQSTNSKRRVQFAENVARSPVSPVSASSLSRADSYNSYISTYSPLVVSSTGDADSISSFPIRPRPTPRRQSSLRLPANRLVNGVRSVVGKRATFSW